MSTQNNDDDLNQDHNQQQQIVDDENENNNNDRHPDSNNNNTLQSETSISQPAALDFAAFADASRSIATSQSCFYYCDTSLSYQPQRVTVGDQYIATADLPLTAQNSADVVVVGQISDANYHHHDSITTGAINNTTIPSITATGGGGFGETLLARTSTANSSLLTALNLNYLNCAPEWELIKKLGEGGFGQCWLGYKKSDPEKHLRAIKIAKTSKGATKELDHELDLLLLMPSHPNIVQPIHYSTFPGGTQLVMEYCSGGSLQDKLEKDGAMSEHVVKEYTRQILIGLAFLHRTGVLHRDLKPANILLSGGKEEGALVKLVDFGLSSTMYKTSDEQVVGGSVRFMSHECFTGSASAASDLWALGCTVCQLMTNKKCWSDRIPDSVADFWKLRSLIINLPLDEKERANHHPLIPEFASKECKAFLKQVFQIEPYQRGTAQQLLSHPWFMGSQTAFSPLQPTAAHLYSNTSNHLLRQVSSNVDDLNSTQNNNSNNSSISASVSAQFSAIASIENLNTQLLHASIMHVEEKTNDARLWSCVARLLPADETTTILGKLYTRTQCMLKSCLLEPNRILYWNMLGRELNHPQWYPLGPNAIAVREKSPQANNSVSLFLRQEEDGYQYAVESKMLKKRGQKNSDDNDETAGEDENNGKKKEDNNNTVAVVPAQNNNSSNQEVQEGEQNENENLIEVDARYCFTRCIEINPDSSVGWRNLGLTLKLGATTMVAGIEYNKQRCYRKAVELDPNQSPGWTNLGVTVKSGETVVINDKTYTKTECFARAIDLDISSSAAWGNLGNQLRANETIKIGNEECSKLTCCIRSVVFNPSLAQNWNNLAAAIPVTTPGAGAPRKVEVAGREVTKLECLMTALALDPKNPARWRTLGYSMAREGVSTLNFDFSGGGHHHHPEKDESKSSIVQVTKKDCYEKAVCLEPDNATRWAELGSVMADDDIAYIRPWGSQQQQQQPQKSPSRESINNNNNNIISENEDVKAVKRSPSPLSASNLENPPGSSSSPSASDLLSNSNQDDDININNNKNKNNNSNNNKQYRNFASGKDLSYPPMTRVQCLARAANLDHEDSISIHVLSKLLKPGEVVIIDNVPHTASNLRKRVLDQCRVFYAKVDEHCQEKIMDHDRFYHCENGHVLLPFRSKSWRCDYCRGRTDVALSCRLEDLDICHKCFEHYLKNGSVGMFPIEVSMGPDDCASSAGGGEKEGQSKKNNLDESF